MSKGTKNFMSPTVSAASKFNASPRKKILSERSNDPIRSSSTSISDLGSSCVLVNVSQNSEEPYTKMTMEASHDSTVTDMETGPDTSSCSPKGSKKRVAFDSVIQEIPLMESTNVGSEDDFVNVDEDFVSCKSPSSSLLTPLDADPLVPLPPYDPKTNYLSPRPQFLHYRQSPRIKHFVGEEGNLKFDPLEYGSDLDGLSDADVTTEETSQSEKDSDDASSNETTKEESGTESKYDGLKVSEEEAAETEEKVEIEEGVETEEPYSRSFFTRPVFIILIFIALVTCSAIVGTHYAPAASYLAVKRSNFSVEVQQLSNSIGENMRLWYANSLTYLSAMVLEFRGQEYEWDRLKFYNLTDLDENPWLGNSDSFVSPIQIDDFENLKIGNGEEEFIEYSETEEEVVAEDGADEGDEFLKDDEPKELEEDKFMDEFLDTESGREQCEILYAEMEEVKTDTEVKLDIEFAPENHDAQQTAETEPDQPELSAFGDENHHDVPKVEAVNHLELPSSVAEDVAYDPKEEQGSTELEDHNRDAFSIISESMETVDSSQIIAPVGVLLTAVACLFYVKKRATSANVPSAKGIQTPEALTAKKFDISPVAANRMTEFDVIGVNSCPSEMSSFQKNAAASRSQRVKTGLGRKDEAQSSERKTSSGKSLRRESTASSFSDLSLGSSPSYGSFTTYGMIPSKHVSYQNNNSTTL